MRLDIYIDEVRGSNKKKWRVHIKLHNKTQRVNKIKTIMSIKIYSVNKKRILQHSSMR